MTSDDCKHEIVEVGTSGVFCIFCRRWLNRPTMKSPEVAA